jgi:acyl-CoA dehydrogenase
MENIPFYAALAEVTPLWAAAVGFVLVAVALGFVGAPVWAWTLAAVVACFAFGAPVWLWVVVGVLAVLFNVPPVRRVLSKGVMDAMKALNFLPVISQTEQTAIEAGSVWVEGELFSGKPDFKRLMAQPYPTLTPEEQAFIDGPVNEVCDITDDWEVFQQRDLPKRTWEKLGEDKFFGMIVPREYGGHGFSALANSAVVQKLSSRSGPLAISVMVPNSLGPAELLKHYGTQAQKDRYLKRLADADEIPAFALTEPNAGSDAGAISSSGEVFRGDDGELYIRLRWKKRYITLAAISTVLGLAFKLRDPGNLLGKGTDLGITCALVPTDTEGVKLGMRHDPLGIPFYNCPTEGENVVVKLEDAVIGGVGGVGNGWRMLMECLAAGRGISLPASAAGGTKLCYRVASAHAAVRKQFGLNIGKFEGIEEPLARIGGTNYLMEAARVYTCGGLDQGAAPAVVTAMMKYNMTELARKNINDAMDIRGGNAISRGPRNLLAHAYINTPVGITVEGANILTRTLMIFGQGAIRCHPYAYKEIDALGRGDVKQFDGAFWAHIGHVARNKMRALVLSLTRGALAGTGGIGGPAKRYAKKLAWASASFAFLADVAMGTLGGDLKRKEKLTGRFADIFSWMYLAAATIKRFEAEGRRKEDRAFFEWSMENAFAQMQEAFDGLYANMKVPGATWLFRGPIRWWSRINSLGTMPSDRLGQKVAQAMQVPGEQRDRHTEGMFIPTDHTQALGILERALDLVSQAYPVQKKLRAAIKAKQLPKKVAPRELMRLALEKGVITPEEAALLQRAEEARNDAIMVDSFTLDEYKQTAIAPDEIGGDGAELGHVDGDGSSVATPVPQPQISPL